VVAIAPGEWHSLALKKRRHSMGLGNKWQRSIGEWWCWCLFTYSCPSRY